MSMPHSSENKLRAGRVLVVDASPVSLIAMAGVLDSQGFECVCARSHAAAIKALQTEPQDVLVCDVGDDPDAALTLVDHLREQPHHESLPVVLIASAQWAGLERKAERLGAVHTLFKPIDPASLLAVVDQALWMPHLVQTHRRRGTRPAQPGWVTLE